jgi:hypothetical protein
MRKDLDIGAVLSRIFAIYGDQAVVLLGVAAVVFVLQALVAGVLFSIATVLIFVALLFQIIASTLYSGMVVELVNDVQDGRRDHSAGTLLKAVSGVVLNLIVAGIVVGVLFVLGLILLVVPGLIVLTIFSCVAPAIVVERKGVFDAMKRSRELVEGNGFRVFGVIVIVFLITAVLSSLISGLGAAGGDAGAIIARIVASTLTAPIAALASAVLYFELRRAKGEVGPAPAAPGPDGVQTTPEQRGFPSEGPGPEAAFGGRE